MIYLYLDGVSLWLQQRRSSGAGIPDTTLLVPGEQVVAQLRIAYRRPEQPILNVLVIGQQCSPDRLRMRATGSGALGATSKGSCYAGVRP
jgi:hypothetical protein